MCLGIVGRIVAAPREHPDLAEVEVAGMTRQINIGILNDISLAPGDWILIHAGFAMAKIDEATAHAQISALREYTGASEIDDSEPPPGFWNSEDDDATGGDVT